METAMEWNEVILGDYCNVISGFAFKSKDFTSKKLIPIVKIKNIRDGYVEFNDDYYVNDEFLKIDEKYHLNKGDVLISLTGSHITLPNSVVGRVAKYQFDKTSLLNQRAGKIIVNDNKKLDQNFLYYFLKTYEMRITLAQFGRGGANQVNISPNNVKSVSIKLPPLPTQQKIASILGAYDDLIENNLKRIQLLEEAAQNLYKEWFVNFKFPNHEQHPIDEETGLPEGWEKLQISEFGEVVTGKTPSTSKEKYYGGKIPFIKTPDMHDKIYVNETSLYLTEEGSETQSKKLLPKNSVLVSCIGTAGVVSITMYESQFNQQINAVKFEEDYKPLYFYFLSKGLKKELEALGSSGATMVNVNKGKFEKIKMINPNKDILILFSKSVKSMFKQVENLIISNKQLREARDLLLPRLMNQDLMV